MAECRVAVECRKWAEAALVVACSNLPVAEILRRVAALAVDVNEALAVEWLECPTCLPKIRKRCAMQ